MLNTKSTSRELYNSLNGFERYLVDEGYMTIEDGQLSMKPRQDFNGYSLEFLTTQYKQFKLTKKPGTKKK